MAIQDVTILAMASLAETRDSETGHHIRRTQFYVKALAEKLRDHPRFAWFLMDTNINTLFKSAPLHDIGKVGIPDRILLKPGRLEPDEFDLMKTHTTLGHDAIERAETLLGTNVRVSFPRQVHCPLTPRKVGWQRLSARTRRRRHSDCGAPDGGSRRLRRPDQPPCV
jgi:putative two-component system response regulator